jgi:hypothetical protein
MALVLIAVFLRLASGVSYLRAVVRGKAKPSVVSWFFWGAIPVIAFVVEVNQHVGIVSLSTLALGVCPCLVFVLALRTGPALRFNRTDKFSATLALLGVILWLVTSDAMLALFFSVLADISSCVPTITKSYREPDSEHGFPYLLSAVSMAVVLAAIDQWNAASYLFPAYTLLINTIFCVLILGRVGPRLRARRSVVLQHNTGSTVNASGLEVGSPAIQTVPDAVA